jgi:membrane protein
VAFPEPDALHAPAGAPAPLTDTAANDVAVIAGIRRARHRPMMVVARAIGVRLWRKLFADRILGLAAEAGFWALLSLPSLVLAIFGALGYAHGIIGASDIQRIKNDVLRAAGDILTPSTVSSDVAPLVDNVLARGHLEVVSVGFVISLWSGSTVMSDYVNTITVAYGMRGLRGAVRSRVVAVGLYLLFVAVGLVLLPALALGPSLLINIFPASVGHDVANVVHVVYLVTLGSIVLLASLYTLALPVRVRWRRGLPGATLAMGLWLLGSFVVRTYLTSNLRAKSTYGALSAPIAALLFFYVTALAVLIGAELNSAIDAELPTRTTAEARARSRSKTS